MKKSLSTAIILALFIVSQSMSAQNATVNAPETAIQPSAQKMLSWFRSLSRPAKQDIDRVVSFLKRKRRCRRYGEGCSVRERNALRTLWVAVAVATGYGGRAC